jgi:hypothetical protein
MENGERLIEFSSKSQSDFQTASLRLCEKNILTNQTVK